LFFRIFRRNKQVGSNISKIDDGNSEERKSSLLMQIQLLKRENEKILIKTTMEIDALQKDLHHQLELIKKPHLN